MRTVTDVMYSADMGLDLFLPETDDFPLFIYFHGGGLETGDKASARHFARNLTECGIALAAVNYRLYPEAHYPDFIRDAAASVAFLKRHISEYGTCTKIFVGGSSAGGYLSMMLCFCGYYLRAVGVEPSEIAGWIHDSAQPTKHFNVLREMGLDTRRVIVDETAPLWWVGTEKSYAKMLFLVSDHDIANRMEQTQLVLSTLRHFGIGEETAAMQIMHGTHCAHIKRGAEEGKNAFGEISCHFILENLRGTEAERY